MKLPKTWLSSFLDDAFARADGRLPAAPEPLRRRAAGLWWRRGLALGTPLPRARLSLSGEVGVLRPLLAHLVALVDAAVGVAGVAGVGPEGARAALAGALRALYLPDLKPSPTSARGLELLGQELRERRYLYGNPLVGLTLHQGLLAIDAQATLELVVDHLGAGPGGPVAEAVRTRVLAEREAWVAEVAHLARFDHLADRALHESAVEWQLKRIGLPKRDVQGLQKASRAELTPAALAERLPPEAVDRHLALLVLVALLDGRATPEELRFLEQMAASLGRVGLLGGPVFRRVQRFCAVHRAHLDPLRYAAAFELDGAPVSIRLARLVRENAAGIWTEVRETGDLALLLARLSAGQKLTGEETRRMKEQLGDLARVIPGLAVFTLPGGALLLPLFVKLLPFDLRPSAFRPGAFRAFDEGEGTLEDPAAGPPKAGPAASVDGGPPDERPHPSAAGVGGASAERDGEAGS